MSSGACLTMENEALAHEACCGLAAADGVAVRLGVPVGKALDPTDPDDYVQIVMRLSRSLSRATRETEAEILRKALDTLDVDWANLSSRQRDLIISAAWEGLATVPIVAATSLDKAFERVGAQVVRGSRRAVSSGLGAEISTSLSLRDQRIIRHLVGSQTLYITDEYKRRRVASSQKARDIVSRALNDGISRSEIADELKRALGPTQGLRASKHYWNVIAGAFTNRARVYGHLSSFADAGVDHYLIDAVLDERTTEQCRFLHGKRFSVSRGLAQYDEAAQLENPEEIKDLMPWPRVRNLPDGEEGEKEIFIRRLDGSETQLAIVTRSGFGKIDDVGSHRDAKSSSELEALGVGLPPYHGLCRTTVVADV